MNFFFLFGAITFPTQKKKHKNKLNFSQFYGKGTQIHAHRAVYPTQPQWLKLNFLIGI